jgi:hypothetical protein
MRSTAMMARWLFSFGFAAALLTSLGCSSGGSDGTTPPALACSAGSASADAVTMTCGGPINATTEQINVVIGGPASGTTSLRGLNFDVMYDPAKLTFVSATNPASGPFSANAFVLATASLDPVPHVVVSIQQVSGEPDVVVNAGQQVVLLHLSFAVASGATTFLDEPLDFDVGRSETTPPNTAISFGSSLVLSYQ